jgi:hypothetical protein
MELTSIRKKEENPQFKMICSFPWWLSFEQQRSPTYVVATG